MLHFTAHWTKDLLSEEGNAKKMMYSNASHQLEYLMVLIRRLNSFFCFGVVQFVLVGRREIRDGGNRIVVVEIKKLCAVKFLHAQITGEDGMVVPWPPTDISMAEFQFIFNG